VLRVHPTHPEPDGSTSREAAALLIWREALIGALWRPGRQNAPTLNAELRRTERRLVEHYWPRSREVVR
jgi:hypothetical protein